MNKISFLTAIAVFGSLVGCAAIDKFSRPEDTVVLNKKAYWTVQKGEFETLDINSDKKIIPAELVPLFEKIILETYRKDMEPQLPPEVVSSEEAQKSIHVIFNILAKKFAVEAFREIDGNLDGQISKEELNMYENIKFPLFIRFSLKMKPKE